MTREDMQRVREEFVGAARRADAAGFDMLLLHMAHGYLLASFLSPLTDQRTDEYGGALENRLRFPLEVFDAVHAVWPREKPLGVVLNADDCAPGGFTVEDAVAVARILKEHGCNLIQPFAGQTVPDGAPTYLPYGWGRYYTGPNGLEIRFSSSGTWNMLTSVLSVESGGAGSLSSRRRLPACDSRGNGYFIRRLNAKTGEDARQ
jgi:anthraniloyl-CoA monooxygenase